MTFQQLQYVSEVAHLGSINRAAQKLFVSQSSISSAIKALETELGIQIFHRSASGISLTEDGREFLVHARSLMDQRNNVERIFSQNRVRHIHRLNVATQHLAFPAMVIIDMMKEYSDLHFDFCIREMLSDDLLSEVVEDRCDFGVIFLSDVMKRMMYHLSKSGGLEFHELMRIRPKVCVRKNHPLAGMKEVSMADLTPYPYLGVFQGYTSPYDHVEEIRLNSRIQPVQRLFATDRATIHDVLQGTDAYHICTGMQTKRESAATELIYISDYKEDMRLGWIKLKHKSLSDEARSFLEKFQHVLLQWQQDNSE